MRSWEGRIVLEEPDARAGGGSATIAEALKLPISPTMNAIFGRAAAEAVAEAAGMVGLRHLILGALQLGQMERTTGETQAQFAAAFTVAVEKATASADFAARIRGADTKGGFDLPLSPMAQAAIEQARLFARLAGGGDFLAARHLIIALTFPLRQELRAALARVWKTRWGIDPEALRTALIEAMERAIAERAAQGRQEDRTAWQSLFGTRRDAPAFAADAPSPAAIDPLGYAEEARRLAELACLRANEPPMAVALFGDWGSGKSTFMNRMQQAVEDIGTTWRDDPASPFCGRVAQVRFNAWTYADGDLWASLAAEIFRQLKGEIARLSGEAAAPAQYRALLDRVALRLGAADAKSREALGEIARISRELEAKRDELARVDRRAAEISAAPASERLQERTLGLLRDRPEAVADALKTLGVLPADAADRARLMVGEAREAASLAGKARLLGRTAWRLVQEPRGWLLLGGGALLLWALPGVSGWIGFAAPLLAWSVKIAKPLLDAADAFEKAEAAERASLAARRTELEAEIAALRRARAAKEEEQTREAALLARYAGAAGGESPAALLKFFLEQDASLSEYEKRLGMVSRLRESFDVLEALLADQHRTGGTTLPAIDRIVLYVDDLDRCQPEQVVPVLQALALMLQLRLFVAVVAVDARWLSAALRIHYKDLIAAEGLAGPEQFLEKIFQIPFWLPPMQSGEVNRFGAFVAHLVPEAVGKAPAEPHAESGVFTTPDGDAYEFTQAEIDPDELPQPGDTDPFAYASKADTVARVSLTEPELNVLSALAPLAGGTPRAVKRFVNLYRLIRASRQAAALDRWLGKQGPPQFAALAFALACLSGLSPTHLEVLLRAGGVEPNTPLSQAWTSLRARTAFKQEESRLANVIAYEAQLDRVGGAIERLQATVGAITVGEVLAAWPEAARFSFNRLA